MLSGRNKVRVGIWGSVEIGRDPLFNTPVVQDAEIKKTWAEVSWRRGKEVINGAGAIFSSSYAYFKVRYLSYPGLSTANWLVSKGSDGVDQSYEIVNVQPDLEDHRMIVIEARVRNINLEPAT